MTCYKCQEPGHFANTCPNNSKGISPNTKHQTPKIEKLKNCKREKPKKCKSWRSKIDFQILIKFTGNDAGYNKGGFNKGGSSYSGMTTTRD